MSPEDAAEMKKAIQESIKDMMPQVVAQVTAAVAPKDPPSTCTTPAKGAAKKEDLAAREQGAPVSNFPHKGSSRGWDKKDTVSVG